MPVMSALVFSIMVELAAAWTKATLITNLLEEFQKIVLEIVSKILSTILPFFIGLTFCGLAYEGSISNEPEYACLWLSDSNYGYPKLKIKILKL